MNPKPPDPVIDEIRTIRHQISAEHDHDPAKLVAHLMQLQQQFRDRLTYDPGESLSTEKPLQAQPARAG